MDGLIGALAGASALRDARVICTAVAAPRALSPDALAARWSEVGGEGRRVTAAPDVTAALDAAFGDGSGGPIVVAGSLYLVGEVRGRLVDDPDLRDP